MQVLQAISRSLTQSRGPQLHQQIYLTSAPPTTSRRSISIPHTSHLLSFAPTWPVALANMDSMRSLNTSLPSNSNRPPPPEQLLQAFRTAALSVTNLYKSAVVDQATTRQAGYQDALDDLLNFLDRENLGVQDGEGWRIRQWATERYDNDRGAGQNHESDDDKEEPERERQTASVERSQTASVVLSQQQAAPAEPAVNNAITNNHDEDGVEPRNGLPVFRFEGIHHAGNQQTSMETDHNPSSSAQQAEAHTETSSTSSQPPLNTNWSARPAQRQGSIRQGNRPSKDFTFTVGTKRKIQFPDFFDISNIGPGGNHGPTGGKRGRFA